MGGISRVKLNRPQCISGKKAKFSGKKIIHNQYSCAIFCEKMRNILIYSL